MINLALSYNYFMVKNQRVALKAIAMLTMLVIQLITFSVNAATLFQDSFESGNLSFSENGVSYAGSTNAVVTSENKSDGSYSLKFTFKGKPTGSDAFSEQRMRFPQTNEIWIEYDLYVPGNYYHRSESGASNNKFLAIYKNDYRYPGFQVNWSLNPNGNGGSNIVLHRYRNGREQSTLRPSGGVGDNFLTAADRGTWVHIVARVKVPSSENSSDGVMQMWKNGDLVTNETSLDNYGGAGENYTDELYLLGWSNSGFTEDTVFYIDNLRINYDAFVRPNPPSSLVIH